MNSYCNIRRELFWRLKASPRSIDNTEDILFPKPFVESGRHHPAQVTVV
jgi:hypothetical protein